MTAAGPRPGGGAEPPDLLLTRGLVVTMDGSRRVFPDGFVAVAGDRIAGVGPMTACPAAAGTIRDLDGDVVLPGLVNCHGHLSNGIHRGLLDEMTLDVWVNQAMWPIVRSAGEWLAYAGARVSISEQLRGGVTTTVSGEFNHPDHTAILGVLRALRESGMRAVVSRMTVDSDEGTAASQRIPDDIRESPGTVAGEVAALRRSYGSDRIEIVPEPLGVLRCSEAMIRELDAFARDAGCRILMHVNSSREEAEESMRRHGRGPIEQLAVLGALSPHLMIAHCVWPSAAEIGLLAGAGVSVSHNPVANLFYAEGIAPLREMLDAGVPVGVGVDGASTNNSQNLWETMKLALLLQKHRLQDARFGSAELALELATIRGAEALGLADRIGSLEAGKQADIIVIAAGRAHLLPHATVMSSLVYSASPDAVRTVLIGGRVVVDDGELLCWPESEVIADANRAAAAMLAATGLDTVPAGRSAWTWIR